MLESPRDFMDTKILSLLTFVHRSHGRCPRRQ